MEDKSNDTKDTTNTMDPTNTENMTDTTNTVNTTNTENSKDNINVLKTMDDTNAVNATDSTSNMKPADTTNTVNMSDTKDMATTLTPKDTVNVESSQVAPNDEVDDKKTNGERDQWSNKLEFLMSCISLSVGLGNIWRFPFTAYENGGGAFLIPYIIVLFVIGKPMYYLEVILGQFANKSPVKMWALCPSFLGVSIGEAYSTTAVLTYYSSLLALSLFYLVMSFQAVLPWAYCREEWSGYCIDSAPQQKIVNVNETEIKMQSSSELYFTQIVLREKDDISDGIGAPNWELTLTLLGSWIIAFLVIIRGIKSLGKVAYFLALFPYAVLIILLIRAVTLDGSVDGIIFFFKPDWGELLNMKVWKEAVVQCFFSLSVSFGPIISFSSYNSFSHNVYRDAMIVTTMDTFTSLLGGVTIFAILGNLAHNLNSDIDKVVRSGTGLAFISYPDAIAKFDVVPQLFAVLFFFMLFVLGVGSLVALTSCIVTIICDQFKLKRFWAAALAVSILGFGVGLVYVTPGGQWILNLVDYYAGTYVVFFLAIFEITGVMWIYGLQNFCDDVEFMLNRKVSLYWRLCWGIITPIMLAGIFIYSMVIAQPLLYAESRYPESADIAGWAILAVGCAQLPIWAVWYFAAHPEDTFVKTIKKGTKPTSKWGPSSSTIKADWIAFKQQRKEQRAKERESKNMSIFSQKLRYIFGFSK